MREAEAGKLPPWLQVLYPFGPHTETVGGQRISLLDEGSGPAVVFLHGNPTWSFLWRNLVAEFRDSYRCLAPDHLGCGFSDKPAAGDYRLAAHIDRLDHVLQARGVEDCHLVVHDWGGAIGFGLVARWGERIRSVTVLNTAAFPYPKIPLRIAICRWPLLGPVLVRGLNGFVRAAGWQTTMRPLSEAVRAGYAFPYDSWGNRVGVQAFVRGIPVSQRHPDWSTLKEIESALEAFPESRLRLLWGMGDWCFHEGILAEWERRKPGAQVTRYAEAGHLVTEDEPMAVAQELTAWLKLQERS